MNLKNIGLKAFTLVELMVVVSIIVILSSFVVVNVSGSQKKAKDDRTIVNAEMIANALDQYAMEHGRVYPVVNSTGVTVDKNKYYFVKISSLQPIMADYTTDDSIYDVINIQYIFRGDGSKAAIITDKPLLDSSKSKCNVAGSISAVNPTIIDKYLLGATGVTSADTAAVFSEPCYYISK